MIVSGTATLVASRLLQLCVLLFAITVLPLGVVRAQNDPSDMEDYLEGVWTRLQQDVAAGSLSQEEARTRMAEIQEHARKRMEYAAMHDRIQAAVEAGEISEEDARERIEGMERHWASKTKRGEEQVRSEHAGSMSVQEYRAAEKKIRKLVEEGEVSAEDAQARLVEMRRLIADESGDRQRRDPEGRTECVGSMSVEEYRATEKKLRKLVADGKVTAEDAEIRLREMRSVISE